MTLATKELQIANDRATQHRTRSAQRAAAEFADAASFTEQWADLTAWASPTAVAVANGKVQGNGQGGGSGANHAFVVKPHERARIVTSVTVPADLAGSRIIIGVSSDVAGAAATSSASTALGMSFTGTTANKWGGGWAPEVSLGALVAGTYAVTVTLDKALISIVAVLVGGAKEFRTSFPRAGYGSFSANNIFVFNSSGAGNTTQVIGALGARKGITTLAPRAGIEGVERTVQWSTVADGTFYSRIALPTNYDARVASPLVIMAHGHGANENMFADDSNASRVANALLAAGYIVASTVGNSTGTEFGSPRLQDAQAALYKYARDHYNVGSIFSYGISMGGLGSLMSAVDPRIPGVKAWCASSPITSLAYANAKTSEGWPASLRTSYGMAADGSDYAAKAEGNDPLTLPLARFAGLPMLVIASPADTTVEKSLNTDLFIARVTPVTSTRVIVASGQHNDTSQYPEATIVAFFDQFV